MPIFGRFIKYIMQDISALLSQSKLTPWGLPIDTFLSKLAVTTIDGVYQIKLTLGFPLNDNAINLLISTLTEYLQSINFQHNFNISVDIAIKTHKVQSGQKPGKSIKNIIAVASGKGGVGKSITTANLARTLALQGAKVGILDADIYGPSQPLIMDSFDHPITNDKKKIQPLICDGIKMMSIGNLIDINSAIIWRGPMVSGALMQLLNDTDWGELDYLFIDLPPGTGDIQLTMTKKIPITGAVIVTTPHDLSIMDARRAIAMFKKVNIHTIGIVENMSLYRCQSCGHQSSIFGQSSAELSEQFDIEQLGKLPLDPRISSAQNNTITNLLNEDNQVSQAYQNIALKITANIAALPKAIMISMPGVKVEYSERVKKPGVKHVD